MQGAPASTGRGSATRGAETSADTTWQNKEQTVTTARAGSESLHEAPT